MKFGETFMEYLHGDQGNFLNKCSHVEYKRLKKVLKICRNCQDLQNSTKNDQNHEQDNENSMCQCQSCTLCDQMFFDELMKEASDVSGCFNSRVRHLLHLHIARGMQRYALGIYQCFKNNQQSMVEEGRMLMEYVTMNAIAIRKILKKYDKIHCSVNGKNFKSKLRAEHIELLQSPWMIELGAFCLNFNGLQDGEFSVSCDLNASEPVIKLVLMDSIKLDYSLTCAICLETVFNPYALSCGHLFCKSCACSAASVMLFQGLKAASPDAKCPVCREANVYARSVHMLELDLLLKTRCKEYWKERMMDERAEMVKQTREFWDLQTKLAIGF
ncbi:SPX (SYG1/Pho81/XPR1) domain-containing protein / zinc finger (C3HC4-type RING finger) protein-related [Euphorbia peplus]|nr:SPX (SYG1/Pho81/XPR1) domain-containing protein / zinc finger (C3HC4-type RING finger) protein-related [Euphorbia peplus]